MLSYQKEKINQNITELLLDFDKTVIDYADNMDVMYFDNDCFGSEYGFLDHYRENAEEIINLIDNIKNNFTEYEIRQSLDEEE